MPCTEPPCHTPHHTPLHDTHCTAPPRTAPRHDMAHRAATRTAPHCPAAHRTPCHTMPCPTTHRATAQQHGMQHRRHYSNSTLQHNARQERGQVVAVVVVPVQFELEFK